jgi:hypothetical protein
MSFSQAFADTGKSQKWLVILDVDKLVDINPKRNLFGENARMTVHIWSEVRISSGILGSVDLETDIKEQKMCTQNNQLFILISR